jgi:hypothetical protein
MSNLLDVRTPEAFSREYQDERDTEREERVIEETASIFGFSREEAIEFLHVPMDEENIQELLVFFGCIEPKERS